MFYQWLAVGLIVVVAVGYVLRRTIRTWTGSKTTGCGGGCGSACKTPAAQTGTAVFVPVEQLTVRPSRK